MYIQYNTSEYPVRGYFHTVVHEMHNYFWCNWYDKSTTVLIPGEFSYIPSTEKMEWTKNAFKK